MLVQGVSQMTRSRNEKTSAAAVGVLEAGDWKWDEEWGGDLNLKSRDLVNAPSRVIWRFQRKKIAQDNCTAKSPRLQIGC